MENQKFKTEFEKHKFLFKTFSGDSTKEELIDMIVEKNIEDIEFKKDIVSLLKKIQEDKDTSKNIRIKVINFILRHDLDDLDYEYIEEIE